MCGIAGYINLTSGHPPDLSKLKKMTDAVSHRGPDGEGFYTDHTIALGHRRLSIIDLSSGDQPMYSDDKKKVLIFNGEIYNYIELRDELKSYGYHFHTTSDSEVIIKAYEKWGLGCQNHFNGMWSFALWDSTNNQLLLSRDRVGEKPLYYSVYQGVLAFGSEIKSLFIYGIPKVQNSEMLEIYLSLGFVPSPYSYFKGIQKLEPGHYLVIKEGSIINKTYWDLPQYQENEMLTNESDIINKFRFLFEDSVRIRMRSDVPYGAFLSGGLDSSSIVAKMSEISSFPVETFTIGYKDKTFDERQLAGLVAEMFHTNHHEFVIEPDSFRESLEKVIHHYDEPFGDSSAIPTGYVSRYAATKVKMALTGDGGDELLSGYTNYQGEKFAARYSKLPGFIQHILPTPVSLASVLFNHDLRYKLNRIQNVLHSSNLSFAERFITKASFANAKSIKQLCEGQPVYKIEDYINEILGHCTYSDPFYKLMYLHLKLTLPDQMLVKVDRMSMAYSLETRAPFLDYRLIEFMTSIHKNVKMHRYERKSVLRNAIGNKLPLPLLSASKKGFAIPLREWFKGDDLKGDLSLLPQSLPFLNSNIINDLVKMNRNGEKDTSQLIWMLFVLSGSANQ